MIQEYTSIGKVVSTHGLEGKVMIKIANYFLFYIKKDNFLFIEINKDTLIPFRIAAVQKTGDNTEKIITFHRINNIEDAKEINGASLWLHQSQYNSNQTLLPKQKLLGYKMHDEKNGDLGLIIDIIEMPHQRIAIIDYKGTEVMIPLVEEFIIRTLASEQTIYMNLPDGILDIE